MNCCAIYCNGFLCAGSDKLKVYFMIFNVENLKVVKKIVSRQSSTKFEDENVKNLEECLNR